MDETPSNITVSTDDSVPVATDDSVPVVTEAANDPPTEEKPVDDPSKPVITDVTDDSYSSSNAIDSNVRGIVTEPEDKPPANSECVAAITEDLEDGSVNGASHLDEETPVEKIAEEGGDEPNPEKVSAIGSYKLEELSDVVNAGESDSLDELKIEGEKSELNSESADVAESKAESVDVAEPNSESADVAEPNSESANLEEVIAESDETPKEITELTPSEPHSESTSDNVESKVEALEKSLEADIDSVVPNGVESSAKSPVPAKNMPSHLIGHDLDKPSEAIKNGRLAVKPRLGVKVPNKNLTSQIVSKQDITEVVMERSRQRQAANEKAKDSLFAKRLTSRLANRILPSGTTSRPAHKVIETAMTSTPSTDRIANNSDLIALLEGDDDGGGGGGSAESDKSLPKINPKKNSDWARQTALRQLQELPHYNRKKGSDDESRFAINPVTKTYTRKRKPSEDIKAILDAAKKPALGGTPLKPAGQTPPVKQAKSTPKPPVGDPSTSKPSGPKLNTPSPKKLSIQKSIQNIRNLSGSGTSPPPPVLPPHAKLSSDKKAIIIMSSPPKSAGGKSLSPNTYISKSSRVVKRKKIWDPDEATPTRSLKSPRPSEPSPRRSSEPSPTPEDPLKPEEKPTARKQTAKKAIGKAKKTGRTEVDRLLMDEGAVNLLYSIQNSGDSVKIKTNISERELLQRTNKVKNDLLQNNTTETDTPIAWRTKAGTPKTPTFKDPALINLHSRKKSKDSAEVQTTPPASPAYAYQNVSRIIRRHSSSSFTSKDSGDETDDDSKKKPHKHRKNSAIDHETIATPAKRIKTDSDLEPANEDVAENSKEAPESDESIYSGFETFNVRKLNNFVQIILVSGSSNVHITLTVKALEELVEILRLLEVDTACNAVAISSAGNSFCLGIDYKELVASTIKERNNVAKLYAKAVREFLLALARFPKVIVAGVHGQAVGLGVTMLPLFDLILASDTATFSAQYARLGCAAEGGCLLRLPYAMHNSLARELFYASRKMTAAEAFRLGLVTRTLWPDKFQDELLSTLKLISSQSMQGLEAIKKQLGRQLTAEVETILKAETKTLVKQWTSAECQANFATFTFDTK